MVNALIIKLRDASNDESMPSFGKDHQSHSFWPMMLVGASLNADFSSFTTYRPNFAIFSAARYRILTSISTDARPTSGSAPHGAIDAIASPCSSRRAGRYTKINIILILQSRFCRISCDSVAPMSFSTMHRLLLLMLYFI